MDWVRVGQLGCPCAAAGVLTHSAGWSLRARVCWYLSLGGGGGACADMLCLSASLSVGWVTCWVGQQWEVCWVLMVAPSQLDICGSAGLCLLMLLVPVYRLEWACPLPTV